MNDERDMVPMVWGYIKSRETARRMDAYAGEVENMVSPPLSSVQQQLTLLAPLLRLRQPCSCS